MNKSVFVKIMATFLAVLMVASLLFSVLPAISAGAVVSQSALKELETKQKELKQKRQDIQSKINSLEYDQSAALAKKAVLDEQMELTENEIDNLTAQITEYTVMIEEAKVQVHEAEVSEAKQWETYKARMRAMEEGGTISYLAVILSATDFSDLLSKIDSVNEVMDYDKQVYKNLVKAREDTIAAKEELEETKAGQEQKKVELEASKTELATQVDEASALLKQIENSLEDYEKFYEETTAEENRVQAEIVKMEEELKKLAESNSGGSVKGTGSFVWPSADSRIVTSKFGTRFHPIYHVYKFHNGIDIGASYGTAVYAADGGKVTTSTYSSSYGNYIVISHGNGYTSLYAHLSKRNVSVGDKVSQGQVIGLIGSTGASTGPHLHFEISKNGGRIDPLQFYSNYTVR